MATLSQSRAPLSCFVEKQTKRFAEHFRAVKRKPTAMHVHELRLAARRLRVAFWLLPRKFPHRDQIRQSLRKLEQHLGGVRELDVALHDSRNLHLPTKKLAKRRARARIHLRSYLAGEHGRDVVALIKKGETELGKVSPPVARRRIAALRRRLNACSRLTLQKPANIHRVRIGLKRVRYALEALGRPIAPLSTLQDSLGKLHDLDVLDEIHGHAGKISKARRRKLTSLSHARENAIAFSRRQLENLRLTP